MKTKTLRALALAALLATPFALAAQQSLPYSYGFEEAAEMNNWTTQSMNTENAANMTRVTTQHNTGAWCFQFASNTSASNGNYNQYLISPELNCPNGMHLNFKYRKHSNWVNERFRVGYSATTADVSSFTWLGYTTTTSGSNTTVWTDYDINLPAGTKYVAINYDSYLGTGTSNYLYIDDIEMAADASCMPVTNLQVISSTIGSLQLSWTDNQNGSGTTYTVFDMSDTTVMADSVTGTTYVVTGLESNSEYTFGVVASCGSGQYSTRVSVTGHTACGIVGDDEMPWGDNFDSYSDGSVSDLPCYKSLNYGYSSNTDYPKIGVTDGVDGVNSKAMVFRVRGTSQYELAILPEFESLYDKSVVFDVKDNGTYYNGDVLYTEVLEVGVMTDPTNQATFTTVQTFSGMNATWVEKTVDLSTYSGNGYYIAFRCHNTQANTNGTLYIDNLYVLESPSCPRLTGVTVDNITGNDATVHIGDTAASPSPPTPATTPSSSPTSTRPTTPPRA